MDELGIEILKGKLDYILELTKELNEDLRVYRRNDGCLKVDEEKLQKLNDEVERFCMNITYSLSRCKNTDLKEEMREMRFEGKRIQNIKNPQILEEKFEHLKNKWKDFLKDTLEIRKALKTQEKVDIEEKPKIEITKRVIDPDNEE